jgi:hypothetical protein
MEFQMRNKTFISSMVGIAAAAAVAGSANAAITTSVLDSFNTDSTAGLQVNATRTGDTLSPSPGWTNFGALTGTKQIAGAAPAISGQPAQTYVFATATQSGGAVTMGVNTAPNAGTIGIPPNGNLSVSYRYDGSFNLSSMGNAFYFDALANDPSNGKWAIQVTSGGTRFSAVISEVGTQVNGRWHVNFSQLTNGATAWTAGYNSVTRLTLGLSITSNIVNSSISGSMGEFGLIPAPGAIALLGAAGLIGARRRRA